MPSNHIILCCPLLLLPSIFPASGSFLTNESVPCMRWPKYWSFSFRMSPSNEYSGLISFRVDWLDILEVGSPCRGKIAFRIKPLTHQRQSEGSNKPCAHLDPETEQELCLSVSCKGTGQQWPAIRGRSSGCSRPGYGISPLGGGRY